MSSPDCDPVARDPRLYPVRIDPAAGEALLLELSEADYRAASFLDDRLAQAGAGLRRDWAQIEEATAALRPRLDFIFHIGHVGSTLISRLLGELPEVFSVREPALLRTLALSPAPEGGPFAKTLLRLYGRTWRPEQRALVKATSFVSGRARELLSGSEDGVALALVATPPSYLRSLLARDHLSPDITELAAARSLRLEARLGAPVRTEGPGELAAMTWLCEVLALEAAELAHPGRVHWADFDRFLREPARVLERFVEALRIPDAASKAEVLSRSPLMGRYSKDLDYAFDGALRRSLQREAEEQRPLEVRRGLDWLQRAVDRWPELLGALRRSAQLRQEPRGRS